MKNVQKMKVQVFVRKLKDAMKRYENSKFVFFIGAGCSVSSGIPGAKVLVNSWLRQLKKLETRSKINWENWGKKKYKGYNKNNASQFFGKIIEDLFSSNEARRTEIERLTEGKDPGFGYSVLAQLMTHKDFGRHCNVVLTVNFDDLIADALYLYAHKKPRVITHEALVGFVNNTRTSPLVFKLHGDARFEPKSTKQETQELSNRVRSKLRNLLFESGLIFIGYGGNDKSIFEILNKLPSGAFPWEIHWISNEIPNNYFGNWLQTRKVTWVRHKNFDELMFYLWNEFELKHPDSKRFEDLKNTYYNTFNTLKEKVEAKPDSVEREIPDKAVQAARKVITDSNSWQSVILEAKKYEEKDNVKADEIYQEGLKRFLDNPALYAKYADFLKYIRKDYDKAEVYYKRAIDANPNDAFVLDNYADFLKYIRKDYDKAEVYYKRAIDTNPNDAFVLCKHADFLKDIRKDYDTAEVYYKRAIDANPNDAFVLDNYADFLKDIRKEDDKSEEYYKRAQELR